VLLAYLPDPLLREQLAGLTLSPYGPNCATGKRTLRAELDQVRDEGVAIEDEELVAGLRSIAVPVLSEEGQALAAIEIAVPAVALSRRELGAALGPALREAAERIAAVQLGRR
jgi:DNA-binding IclR family transcriptional regulator